MFSLKFISQYEGNSCFKVFPALPGMQLWGEMLDPSYIHSYTLFIFLLICWPKSRRSGKKILQSAYKRLIMCNSLIENVNPSYVAKTHKFPEKHRGHDDDDV